jgi:hypothetical protein
MVVIDLDMAIDEFRSFQPGILSREPLSRLGEEMPKTIPVRVLHTSGCPNLTPTIDLIERIGSELGIAVTINRVLISSVDQAVEPRCLGSPTVQINGIDIEPAARSSMNFGLG